MNARNASMVSSMVSNRSFASPFVGTPSSMSPAERGVAEPDISSRISRTQRNSTGSLFGSARKCAVSDLEDSEADVVEIFMPRVRNGR